MTMVILGGDSRSDPRGDSKDGFGDFVTEMVTGGMWEGLSQLRPRGRWKE